MPQETAARSIINALSLSHFRSHQHSTLALDGRPVAISGPNGAGKTNILEALSLLSPGRGLRRAHSASLTRQPEALGWKVSAQILQTDGTCDRIETGATQGQPRFVRVNDKAAGQLTLAHLCRMLWLVPTMDRLWIEGAEGRRRFLDRMAMSFFPDHAVPMLAYDKALRQRNALLKDRADDGRWYHALEQQMAEASQHICAHRRQTLGRLNTAQQGGQTSFPIADLYLIDSNEVLWETPAALCDFWARSRREDLAAGRTLTGPHRMDMGARYTAKGITVDQCSTGEQKALLISLVLANARALRQDHGFAPILLLDEVAAHLDADRREALYQEIEALGAQAFMTGTEALLFDGLLDKGQAQHFSFDENGTLVELR